MTARPFGDFHNIQMLFGKDLAYILKELPIPNCMIDNQFIWDIDIGPSKTFMLLIRSETPLANQLASFLHYAYSNTNAYSFSL